LSQNNNKDDDDDESDNEKKLSSTTDTKAIRPGDGTQTTPVVSKYVSNAAAASRISPADFDSAKLESNHNQNEYDGLEEGWIMTAEMKNLIGQSEWLRSELNDVGLQHLIARISGASNRTVKIPPVGRSTHKSNHNNHSTTEKEQLLEELKAQNPLFRQFLDKLLVVAGVLERNGDDATVPLQEWLLRNDIFHDQLTLKPLATRPCQNRNLDQQRQLSITANTRENQDHHQPHSSTSSTEGSSNNESSVSSDEDD
jgi:hypothetical protein